MKLHLVDGTYELFRAYYGGQPHTNARGVEVGGVRTLVASLLVLLRGAETPHVGVAFDHVIESFRNTLFDGYKTGEGIDPLLFGQFGLAEVASEALGLVTWPMVEFEADDAMASAAAMGEKDDRVEQILLCSPDKDLAQCVNGSRVVMFDRMRRTILDEARVVEKFGVAPASIPDYLALVGDTADGIPGIKGWGARSAAALLSVYGHVENIPENPTTWTVAVRGAARLAQSLNENRVAAKLYRELATLRLDAPLGVDVDGLAWHGPHPEKLAALAVELEEPDLVARVADVFNGTPPPAG
ncbi:MAG TPA: 5'-3' exonuclease H3TH domain-containing protein [Polyangiaceae bacterium]|nr:5'-3' exonuclease H3TH domain-containing protein [Polyangiaceae bacterium]